MIVTNPQGGYLRILTKYHWMAFMLALFAPKAVINGHTVALKWGENVIPIPLSTHQVEIFVPYLWKFGSATIAVDNTQYAPTIHYAAPVWAFGGGAIGFEPQKHPGLTAAYILYGVLAAVIVLCCCGSFLLSLADNS
ncbi:hypothetical protein Prum_009450 [Phytohabitans rumicis]|uniref:Uncharacterized protein n=2 Tax=Phytohabitans rumicis TaxID=1076125 RepID=A0A6V8KQ44_9ACTN|nr:hypothetical protein Prum_009450 [Phytohabitans rumicis]